MGGEALDIVGLQLPSHITLLGRSSRCSNPARSGRSMNLPTHREAVKLKNPTGLQPLRLLKRTASSSPGSSPLSHDDDPSVPAVVYPPRHALLHQSHSPYSRGLSLPKGTVAHAHLKIPGARNGGAQIGMAARARAGPQPPGEEGEECNPGQAPARWERGSPSARPLGPSLCAHSLHPPQVFSAYGKRDRPK